MFGFSHEMKVEVYTITEVGKETARALVQKIRREGWS
jgi:hypothetical protein